MLLLIKNNNEKFDNRKENGLLNKLIHEYFLGHFVFVPLFLSSLSYPYKTLENSHSYELFSIQQYRDSFSLDPIKKYTSREFQLVYLIKIIYVFINYYCILFSVKNIISQYTFSIL